MLPTSGWITAARGGQACRTHTQAPGRGPPAPERSVPRRLLRLVAELRRNGSRTRRCVLRAFRVRCARCCSESGAPIVTRQTVEDDSSGPTTRGICRGAAARGHPPRIDSTHRSRHPFSRSRGVHQPSCRPRRSSSSWARRPGGREGRPRPGKWLQRRAPRRCRIVPGRGRESRCRPAVTPPARARRS